MCHSHICSDQEYHLLSSMCARPQMKRIRAHKKEHKESRLVTSDPRQSTKLTVRKSSVTLPGVTSTPSALACIHEMRIQLLSDASAGRAFYCMVIGDFHGSLYPICIPILLKDLESLYCDVGIFFQKSTNGGCLHGASGLKSYNNDVKYGYVQKDLTKDEAEYLKLFKEEIEERLKHRRHMRRWEMFLSYAALDVLTTRPACHSSLASCFSSLGESLPSVPGAYAVVVPDMPGYGSRMHTHDHGGSEAPDGLPDSILSSKPKPLGKHRPPPPQSILSPKESSYPP
ncbi:hypothetical protein Tco_1200409 [Tanacetum coccineum]